MNAVEVLWREFLAHADVGSLSDREPYDVFAFGDSPAMADELAALVVSGSKTATTSLLAESDGANPAVGDESIAAVGGLSIVTNGAGLAQCIIETVEVRVLPFEDVDEAMARDEGEGDRTLASWRQSHWAFFSRECAELGRVPSMDMLVVFERFRVVHRADS